MCLAFLLPALLYAEDRTPRGRAGQFDFYLLTLSWSPAYCQGRSGDAECRRPLGFVLHGFWPQYNNGRWPQFCSQAPGLRDPSSILDIMPKPALIRHEWERHGVCSGLSAEDYFALARRAFESIRIPQRLLRPTRPITISPAELERELAAANPGLTAGGISLQCSRQYLSEVRVCLNKNLGPIPCTAERGCARPAVTLLPVSAR